MRNNRRGEAADASDEEDGDEEPSKDKNKFDNNQSESEYTLWLSKKYPGYFPGGFNHFDTCRRCSNNLKDHPELAKELRQYCDEHCVYSDPKLVNADAWWLLGNPMGKLEAHGL